MKTVCKQVMLVCWNIAVALETMKISIELNMTSQKFHTLLPDNWIKGVSSLT